MFLHDKFCVFSIFFLQYGNHLLLETSSSLSKGSSSSASNQSSSPRNKSSSSSKGSSSSSSLHPTRWSSSSATSSSSGDRASPSSSPPSFCSRVFLFFWKLVLFFVERVLFIPRGDLFHLPLLLPVTNHLLQLLQTASLLLWIVKGFSTSTTKLFYILHTGPPMENKVFIFYWKDPVILRVITFLLQADLFSHQNILLSSLGNGPFSTICGKG